VHDALENDPEPSLLNLNVPPGVLAAASLTVAVHLVDAPTSTDAGAHETTVLVWKGGTVKHGENSEVLKRLSLFCWEEGSAVVFVAVAVTS
jgi:hypothetical protein